MNAVDTYVIYDDVNYIKGGWINRNFILAHGEPQRFTMHVANASSNRKICDLELSGDLNELRKTLKQVYAKSINYADSMALLDEVFAFESRSLSRFIGNSLQLIARAIGARCDFFYSSDSRIGLEKVGQDRVLEICNHFAADTYINAIGGQALYSPDAFAFHGIDLRFLRSLPTEYPQQSKSFIPNLSIVDVLMNNEFNTIPEMMGNYELV